MPSAHISPKPDISVASATLPYVLATVLLACFAFPVLKWWIWEYTRPDSFYGYAFLVPFLCAILIWRRRARIAAAGIDPQPWALLPEALSLCIVVIAVKHEMRALQSLGLLGTVWSASWLVLGDRAIRPILGPLALLAMMAPLPGPLLNDLTLGFQSLSTSSAAHLLSFTGFANTQSGNIVSLSNFTLSVDVPCSGFKTLIGLIVFNGFFVGLIDTSVWKKWLLFALCLPMAIAINSCRIALIGVVGELVSDQAAHVFHDYSALITVTFGFVAFFLLARVLKCFKFEDLAIS